MKLKFPDILGWTWRNKWILIAFAFFAAVRIAVFVTSDNGIDMHHNAYDRSVFVLGFEGFRYIHDPAYGPAHFTFLALMKMLVTGDPVLGPRVLSLLAGLACFPLLYFLTRRLFGDQAAFWACAFLIFAPLHARLTAISLEVTLYMAFVLGAMLLFERGFSEGTPYRQSAALSGFMLSLACATRFESWLLVPLFLLIGASRDLKKTIAMASLGVILPIFMLANNAREYGDPLYFLKVSSKVASLHMMQYSLYERLIAWPKILFWATPAPAFLLALAGGYFAVRTRRGLLLGAAFIFTLIVFIVRTCLGTLGFNETKYAGMLAVWALPFAGFAAARFSELALKKESKYVVVGLMLGLTAFVGIGKIIRDSYLFQAPSDLKETTAFLERFLPRNAQVIIGPRDKGYLIIKGNLKKGQVRNLATRDIDGRIDADQLLILLRSTLQIPLYLVFDSTADNLSLRNILPLDLTDPWPQKALGHMFLRAFSSKNYGVFRVDPPMPGE